MDPLITAGWYTGSSEAKPISKKTRRERTDNTDDVSRYTQCFTLFLQVYIGLRRLAGCS